MAETVNQETNGTAAETQENEQRTFTQAEMNAIIQDRLCVRKSPLLPACRQSF